MSAFFHVGDGSCCILCFSLQESSNSKSHVNSCARFVAGKYNDHRNWTCFSGNSFHSAFYGTVTWRKCDAGGRTTKANIQSFYTRCISGRCIPINATYSHNRANAGSRSTRKNKKKNTPMQRNGRGNSLSMRWTILDMSSHIFPTHFPSLWQLPHSFHSP